MRQMRILTALLLVVAAFCLALGVTQPLIRFETFVFFSSTPSLVEIVAGLWRDGEALLSLIIALFSIVFPAAKILAAQAVFADSGRDASARRKLRTLLGIVSKWSMMDVVLVALAIFAAKTTGLADAFTQPGLWFYATSVTAAAAASFLLR